MTHAVVLAKVIQYKNAKKDMKKWKTSQTQSGIITWLVKIMKKALR